MTPARGRASDGGSAPAALRGEGRVRGRGVRCGARDQRDWAAGFTMLRTVRAFTNSPMAVISHSPEY